MGNLFKSFFDDSIVLLFFSVFLGIMGKGSIEVKILFFVFLCGVGRSKLDESCSVGRLMWGLYCFEVGS